MGVAHNHLARHGRGSSLRWMLLVIVLPRLSRESEHDLHQ